jgi:hypothetical protein
MADTNTNPIGNPRLKEVKREESVTQEVARSREIPLPTSQQPQESSSEPD